MISLVERLNARLDAGQELLTNDRLQIEHQALAHGIVHISREKIENSADRAGSGGGVDRAEHQVTRFGGVHARFERVAIAHFAHEYDVRILTHGMFESGIPIKNVDADLALVDDGLLVLEEVFNRVFNREDMHALALVDVVEHGRDGRAFAAPGDAGKNDHALIVMASFRSTAADLTFRRWAPSCLHAAPPG